MKLIRTIVSVFIILIIPSVGSFSVEKLKIESRDDAIKYYKESFKAIRFHKNGKEVSFDFSDSKKLTDDDLIYLKFFPETTVALFGGRGVSDRALEYLK
ncbi:MAG TPA: hypothetical protein PKG60_12210, partial [Spirochaetota bacterium]|nr:hypothetical protein [Spirochaetota bacterium]